MVHHGRFPKYLQLGDVKQQKVFTAQGCLAHRENDTEVDSDLGAASAREEHLFICTGAGEVKAHCGHGF